MPVHTQHVAKSKRQSRTDQVLAYLAGVNGSLYYEFQMMNEAAKKWSDNPAGIEYNMATESFLVHFRNVRNFLYPPVASWTSKSYFDDAIAFDFSPSWLYVADDWVQCSPNERDRIDKLLAHISYSRPYLDHRWPVLAMVNAMRTSLSKFVLALPTQRQSWFKVYGL